MSPGIHIRAEQDSHCRSEEHYNRLATIFRDEMNLGEDSLGIQVLFISDSLFVVLKHHNPEWFRFKEKPPYGMSLGDAIVLISDERESDGTFFHELTHIYWQRQRIGSNLSRIEAEHLADKLEAYMLASEGYLGYLRGLRGEEGNENRGERK